MTIRNVPYCDVSATATLTLGKNAMGLPRVTKITIDAEVVIPGDAEDDFKRVEKVMRKGCLVTSSIHEGIEMVYNLKHTIME